MDQDRAIVELVLRGETERFSALVDRYREPLLRLALSRLGRWDWAEDAVQETFLCAYKSLPSYRSRFSFRTWLWTILLNQCRRHVKKLQRQQAKRSNFVGNIGRDGEDDADLRQLADPTEGPEQQALLAERLRRIEVALRQLRPATADAIRLRFFGELKFQEIAEVQRCSLSTAKNRVRDGLRLLNDSPWLEDQAVQDEVEQD